ncbi:MAG: ATP-grasp domain-containing protein [Odoribacter sp.]|nr:ATP-grasp domain-containing protein [Odoribacter sp.]
MAKKTFDNKVIVFGGSHHNTLGLVRSLGEESVDVYVVIHGVTSSFVSQSIYITECKFVKNGNEGIEYIIQNFSKENLKPIILCSSDEAACIVDVNYDRLKDDFFFANAGKAGRITNYMNKEELVRLAKECGFNVPRSWSISNKYPIQNDISFPCITKPLLSVQGSKADMFVCHTKQELEENLLRRKEFCSQFQLQEYLEKDYEISLLGYINKKKLVLPGVIKKIREYPIKRGSSSFAVLLPFDEFDIERDAIKEILERIGYTGLFSIEFIRYEGKNYFLEINFRNDGNGYIPVAAGVNLPYLLCLSLLGIENENMQMTVHKPYFFMADFRDFRHIFDKRLTLQRWWKDLRKTDIFLVYNKYDKTPFICELKSIIGKGIKRFFRLK